MPNVMNQDVFCAAFLQLLCCVLASKDWKSDIATRTDAYDVCGEL